MTDDDEDRVRVVAEVPRSVKETAKERLEHGGMSREIREMLERIAFGEDLTQRSRLERQREELAQQRDSLREERREIDAEIENLDQRIDAVDRKLSNITTREDKYEAKLEELEQRVRMEGARVFIDHPAVKRAAETGAVEQEGVIETLKERNPDVPVYAFQQGIHDAESWDGLPSEVADRGVDERVERD